MTVFSSKTSVLYACLSFIVSSFLLFFYFFFGAVPHERLREGVYPPPARIVPLEHKCTSSADSCGLAACAFSSIDAASPRALVIVMMSQGGLSDPIGVARRSHRWTHPDDRDPHGKQQHLWVRCPDGAGNDRTLATPSIEPRRRCSQTLRAC